MFLVAAIAVWARIVAMSSPGAAAALAEMATAAVGVPAIWALSSVRATAAG